MSATQAVNISSSLRVPKAGSAGSLTYVSILVADLCAFSCSWLVLTLIRHEVAARFGRIATLSFVQTLLLFAFVFLLAGLYPGIALNPVEEFRRILRCASLGMLVTVGLIFYLRDGFVISGAVFLLGWAFTLTFTVLGRHLFRGWCSSQAWWGIPTVILGEQAATEVTHNLLRLNTPLGLRPVAILYDAHESSHSVVGMTMAQQNIFVGDLSHSARIALDYPGCYAIVSMPLSSRGEAASILTDHTSHFHRVLVIPEQFSTNSLSVTAKDIFGVLALEVEQKHSRLLHQLLKRSFDVITCVAVGVIMSPLLLSMYILVRLTSAGPAFYGHSRIGRGGKRFKVWKFRTMIPDADKVLETHLQRDPALRAEWERDQKLRNDPRTTLVGRFLRKTSLDELPQLWNVIRGEMSLVGPRPIVTSEVERYGASFRQYCRVTPGITGLWQISGRNNTTYQLRTQLDEYYVRNWSFTFDLYIVLYTLRTILLAEGAY